MRLSRLLAGLGRDPASRVEQDIREELELHLELRTADNVAAGMAPGIARRDAEARFGNSDNIVRAGRKVRLDPSNPLGEFPGSRSPERARVKLMTDFVYDLKHGLRMLAKSPGFTGVAVLSLALGIGFNSTMFTLIDAVMFKPLAAKDPDSLVRIRARTDGLGGMMSSYPNFVDLRDQSETLAAVGGFRTEMTTYNNQGQAEFVFGETMTAETFEILGIEPILGRSFAPDEDDHIAGDFVVMVSEGFWRTRLGADPEALGRQLQFGGRPYTLIGVVPSSYSGATPPLAANFWLPMSMIDLTTPGATGTGSRLDRRGSRNIQIVARLGDGVTLEAANEEVGAIGAALVQEYPEANEALDFEVLSAQDVRIDPSVDSMMLPASGVLMGVVGLVLLIACANVANMMLARGSMRRQEVAVRQAMGASRFRLVRQLMTESLLLALIGGGLAVAVAAGTIRMLQSVQPPVMVPIDFHIPIDPRVLAFTGLISVLTGLLFGVIPALKSTRTELTSALKSEDPRSGSGKSGKSGKLRSTLVAVQVAVSLVLLISAALLARSLMNAQTIDPGIETESVVSMVVGLAFQGYNPDAARDFHNRVIEQIEVLPGVQSAGFAERMPLESTTMIDRDFWLQDKPLEPDEDPPLSMAASVSPEYFSILGITAAAGRLIGLEDIAEAPHVVVVNQAFADEYWPGDNPIGKLLSVTNEEGPWAEVIGVNSAHKVMTLGEDPRPHLYLAYDQYSGSGLGSIVVRTSADPAPMLDAMRRIAQGLDPNLAIMETKTIRQHLSLSLFPVRLAAASLGVLGAVGALLAAVGVYGVVAFAVARRRYEIGIRMAVGADRAGVVKLILRQGMGVVLIGVAIGLAASLALTRVLGAILYGISATDIVAFVVAAGVLALVAIVANLIPALRASRVDPIAALRSE